MESKKKSYIKTISWETFHLLVLASIIYVITGDLENSGIGAIFYIAVESLGYFVHERIWAKFGSGVK